MSAHTPGPWKADGCGLVWAEALGEYVAVTYQIEDYETVPLDQAVANTKLIAAAPDLLGAVGVGLIVIGEHNAPQDCYSTDLFECGLCPACAFIAAARAALAKAGVA